MLSARAALLALGFPGGGPVALRRMPVRIPHMHRVLPDGPSRWQAAARVSAVRLTAGGVIESSLAPAGGVMVALSATWLLVLIGSAVRRYRQASRTLA